jgi:hypothetical protein
LRQTDQIKKKREELIQTGREAQGTLLGRLLEAAQRLGLSRTASQIKRVTAEQEIISAKELVAKVGIDPTQKESLFDNPMITQFAQTQGELQREADTRLFESVETMRGLLKETLEVIIDRLGVPVLRSAS